MGKELLRGAKVRPGEPDAMRQIVNAGKVLP